MNPGRYSLFGWMETGKKRKEMKESNGYGSLTHNLLLNKYACVMCCVVLCDVMCVNVM
jgi:hypothetical protein